MTEVAAAPDDLRDVDLSLLSAFAAAVVAGGGLAAAANSSASLLLGAVAVVQTWFALVWVFGTSMPGRKGGFVVAAFAACAADVAVSVWPHGRLGTLLAVIGLAVPVLFVHQLMRGAARVRLVSSLASVAFLVLGEVSLPAYLQLRHEFSHGGVGGRVSATAISAIAAALVVGCFVDMILPAPRFDPAVGRGLLALIASTGLGGSVGYLLLHRQSGFDGGRAAFVGGALGALAGLLAVATAFVLSSTPEPANPVGRRLRPQLSALLPLVVLAPVAFLLCLALRT